ncbi:radical SAM protein [Myxococcota bacterium]|nr:radical SAM protein [Myxococcota bacterium]
MKVAFVSGNREQLPDPVIPLGIITVATNLPASHPRVLVDLCFEDHPIAALSARLQDFEPDLVAVGMRNIQSADYSGKSDSIEYYRELIRTIRQLTGVPIVLGGSGFSVMPSELMEALRPDYGLSGEADQSFAALVEALERGSGIEKIPNLHFFEGDRLVSSVVPVQYYDLRSAPQADRSLVDPRHYEVHGIEGVQTKRGCPLSCMYCTYPLIEGKVGRARKPGAVAEEFLGLVEGGRRVEHVFIVDSVFNLPRRHAKEVCQALIERSVSIPWTCYANPLGFDEALAQLMKDAGCAGMEIGSDSGTDKQLLALKKGFTTDDIRSMSRMAKSVALPDCHTFLLGTPGEGLDDVRRTLDFIIDLDPFGAILMAWVDDYEMLDAELAIERQRLREAVLELLDSHKSEFPWWSIPSIGANYDPALFHMLRRRGYHGPLWQHMRKLVPPRAPKQRRARQARAGRADHGSSGRLSEG